MAMLKWFMCFVVLSLPFGSHAQLVTKKTASKKSLKLFEKSRLYYGSTQLIKAEECLLKLIESEPGYIDAHLMAANLYQEDMIRNEDKTMHHLQEAIALDSFYSKAALFRLSELYYDKGEYNSSRECAYSLTKQKRYYDRYKKDVDQLIASNDYALERLQAKIDIAFKSLKSINTLSAEVFPTLNANSSDLYFGRIVKGQEDIYQSTWQSDDWVEAKDVFNLNTFENESTQALSSDGNTIIFTRCNTDDGRGSCDLYWSTKRNGKWSLAKNVGAPINTSAWESQPCLAEDGQVLIFSSNRPGGQGGKDLYYSRLNEGVWTEPKTLGDKINTSGDEGAPFFHYSGRDLYFMSTGHKGMGKQDIFLAKGNLNAWDTILHLPPPINSHLEEASLIVELDGQTAYYARQIKSKEEGRYRNMDIFQFDLPEAFRPERGVLLTGTVLSEIGKAIVKAKIKIYALNDPYEKELLTDQKGNFLLTISGNRPYGISVVKEDYVFHSEEFHSPPSSLDSVKIKHVDVTLKSFTGSTVGAPPKKHILNNVFFDSGKSSLTQESNRELMELVGFLNANPTLRIKISGHTDNVGKPDANQELSQSRAKSVHDFLIAQGIALERLNYMGYGEDEPIASNYTDTGRKRNRRTEFEVISD